jgi:peptide/nickel transport system permease protein
MRRFRNRISRSLIIGSGLLAIPVLTAIFAPVISPHSPTYLDLTQILEAPGAPGHILGTDSIGRDLLSRIIFGSQISLLVAGLGMLGALVIGVAVGSLAAFTGRFGDLVVMRFVDVQLAFPYILLAIAITSAVRPTVGLVIGLLVLAGWAGFARVVRSAALQEISRDYVKAATLLGASRTRIAWKYVFPNLLPPIMVLAAMLMAAMVLIEATLAFLGMGVPPPAPSWGTIILDARNYLGSAWWLTVLPGLGILLTAVALNLIADGLQTLFGTRIERDAVG